MSARVFLLPYASRHLLYDPLRDIAAVISADDCAALRGETDGLHALASLLDLLRRPVTVPEMHRGRLAPEFLGLITTRGCSMACRYCDFVSTGQGGSMDPATAFAGIALMGKLAQQQGNTALQVHFFGGEPFMAWDLVRMSVERARSEAQGRGLRAYFEASTNGFYSARKAAWIGANLHKVVLSLDGPPALQNDSRPGKSGAETSERVETTARIIGAATAELYLRTCVTAKSVHFMDEIVEYFLDRFRPSAISLEPVQGGAESAVGSPDPDLFVRKFARAFTRCEECGVELVFSGAQIGNKGVSLCPVGNDGLILHPNGRIAACYLPETQWIRRGLELSYGWIGEAGTDQPRIVPEALRRVRALTGMSYSRCRNCFCRWHCAGGCHVNHSFPGNQTRRDELCHITRAISYWLLLTGIGAAAEAEGFLQRQDLGVQEQELGIADAGVSASGQQPEAWTRR